MELVTFGKDVLQNIAEHAASYRLGQSVLRHLDRGLWVVEKCARWAVPPPLDLDERPQPELVRPLPWPLFLMMLITLRVTRESISLLNLVMGKPPLRSVDVVMFIQGKRRYLRTLKYQGNRMMRARTSTASREPWYNSLYKLFELTMCFRRQSDHFGNNNTTRVSNNDEVMVVKRTKRGRQETSPTASAGEMTMERLIERMMVDMDAESDEESSYTLTNTTNPKSDASDFTAESDDVTLQNECSTPPKQNGSQPQNGDDIPFSPTTNITSTPEGQNQTDADNSLEMGQETPENISETPNTGKTQIDIFRENMCDSPASDYNTCEESTPVAKTSLTTKQASENLILTETQRSLRTPKDHKTANGRTVKSVPNKKKVYHRERKNSNEVPPARVLSSNNSF